MKQAAAAQPCWLLPQREKGRESLITDDIIAILCEPEAKASYSP